jgi:5-formyltetrahydrofolate cyclo-ligase
LADSSRSNPARRRLRQRIRKQRRMLPRQQRRLAQRSLALRIQRLGAFRRARKVAVYIAFDGEPDLSDVVRIARRNRIEVFAPVLLKRGLGFVRLIPEARYAVNHLGILEPERVDAIDPRTLDLVLTPLVAFDERGVRLGMGGGYYDRCFKHLLQRRSWRKPKLLGIGYDFQRLPHLQAEPWDVRLWGAVTESGTYRF